MDLCHCEPLLDVAILLFACSTGQLKLLHLLAAPVGRQAALGG
jgi:hypothetical protein